MTEYYNIVGMVLCGLGGGLLCLCVLGLLLDFACVIWVKFSNKIRNICKAESLIFEYRKNRDEFLLWKYTKEGDTE